MDTELVKLLAGLVVIITGVFAVFKYGKNKLRQFWRWVRRQPSIPLQTITIVPDQVKSPWWHMGSENEAPGMQIVSNWYVTNITDKNVHMLGARMRRPKSEGNVWTTQPTSNVSSPNLIQRGTTTEVTVDFWIKPPVREKGEDFKATIALIDQFGNEHWIKRVKFRYQ